MGRDWIRPAIYKHREEARMETPTGTKKLLTSKVVIITAVVVALAAVGAAVAIVINVTNKEETPERGIGYSTEASVILNQEELQAAMDQAMENARDGNVALLYKNNAYSTDGSNFDCYIVNSASNAYDMFLTIYADIEMTDEIYLSRLVPPGSGFNTIELEHPLEPGDHEVYVVLTQVKVDEETGEEFAHNQVVHTMDFHVVEGE